MHLRLLASEPPPRWCGSPPKRIDKREICKQQGDQRDPLRKRSREPKSSTDKLLRTAVTGTVRLTSTLWIYLWVRFLDKRAVDDKDNSRLHVTEISCKIGVKDAQRNYRTFR